MLDLDFLNEKKKNFLQKELKAPSVFSFFPHLRIFVIRRSVSEWTHYVIRDLWMDQLLESVGMLVIDRAGADVTCHSLQALFLFLSLAWYDQYVTLWPWGSLAHFMLDHVAESKLFRCSECW